MAKFDVEIFVPTNGARVEVTIEDEGGAQVASLSLDPETLGLRFHEEWRHKRLRAFARWTVEVVQGPGAGPKS